MQAVLASTQILPQDKETTMEVWPQLPAESEQFILSFHQPGLGYDACVEQYNKEDSVRLYADSAVKLAYRGPRYVADMLSALIENKDEAVVLDVVAGTGLVGEELHRHGFKNIHAHDGAMNMLETCKKKGIYSEFICCFLNDGFQMPIPDNTYDAVTCSGGTCENHLPPAVQEEFARILKPGGIFVNSYRSTMPTIEYGQAWEREAQRLEKDNKWLFYGRLMFRKYNVFSDGFVDIYQAA